MKITGCIFRKSEIREYTKTTFLAHYKKREFYITSNQGYGKAKEPGKQDSICPLWAMMEYMMLIIMMTLTI